MDLNVEYCAETHMIEVALADTTADMRRKVASAVGLPEDSFDMRFRDEAMGEGADMTQLSAGDTIEVAMTKKFEAVAALRALGETDLTEERFYEVEDPEVACLLLQAEVATTIPNGFFLRTSLTQLDLSAVSFVTCIGDAFLSKCTSLTSVDLSGLSNVKEIGECFLSECESLTTLDLSPFRNVTRIQSFFISDCKALTTSDLSPLISVTDIGCYFLSECKSLTSLDLSSLNKVTEIGSDFLGYCKSLTSLDLSSLSNVTDIGSGFLVGCESLTTLDLSALSKLENVDEYFAEDCTSLTSIYLTGCSSAVSNDVKNGELKHLVVAERPKRSRDESPEQARKRQRHAQ